MSVSKKLIDKLSSPQKQCVLLLAKDSDDGRAILRALQPYAKCVNFPERRADMPHVVVKVTFPGDLIGNQWWADDMFTAIEFSPDVTDAQITMAKSLVFRQGDKDRKP